MPILSSHGWILAESQLIYVIRKQSKKICVTGCPLLAGDLFCRLALDRDSSGGGRTLVVASWGGTLWVVAVEQCLSQFLQRQSGLCCDLGWARLAERRSLWPNGACSRAVSLARHSPVAASTVPDLPTLHMLNNAVLTGGCSSQTNFYQDWLLLQLVCERSLSVWCLKAFYQPR